MAIAAEETMTIRRLANEIRQGSLSPVELARQTLDRINRAQPTLNAYITVTEELALEQARRAEREIREGRDRGPLHGIPFAAKDLFYTRGIRTTVGSRILRDFIPDHDAAVIEKLREAGAVLIGKTGLHEWAYGITSNNPHFGAIHNPWDRTRIPGGSSGGSTAALAAGLCSFSLGSDTGGSIRIPASFCGVVGLKPTFGRVSRWGMFPVGYSLDHAGPFAHTVEDAALVYQAMAGHDARDETTVARPVALPAFAEDPRLEGRKIGLPRNFYYENLDPAVDQAVNKALVVLGELGAELTPIDVPDMEEFNSVGKLILAAEATSVHSNRLQERREDFGDDVRALLEQGETVLATEYLEAQKRRRELVRDFNRLFGEVDVIAVPTAPIAAPRIGAGTVSAGALSVEVRQVVTRLVRAVNLGGWPTLSVPCGFTPDGLPIGLQLMGTRFEEEGLLEVGHAYQQVTEWRRRQPPLYGTP